MEEYTSHLKLFLFVNSYVLSASEDINSVVVAFLRIIQTFVWNEVYVFTSQCVHNVTHNATMTKILHNQLQIVVPTTIESCAFVAPPNTLMFIAVAIRQDIPKNIVAIIFKTTISVILHYFLRKFDNHIGIKPNELADIFYAKLVLKISTLTS